MEGGAVAQVCEAFGIPWLVDPALSDLAGGNALFDFTTFVDQAAASSAVILRHLLPVLRSAMTTDLLTRVLDAHGGIDRWRRFTAASRRQSSAVAYCSNSRVCHRIRRRGE